MAKFEGVQWAPRQLQHVLETQERTLIPFDAQSYTISRSLHYGIFLVFEGIRFFCFREKEVLKVRFINLNHNFNRFRDGISYCLSAKHKLCIPTDEDFEETMIHSFLRSPALRSFLEEMADLGAQGYLRPYTLDNDQSIGVTYPSKPAIRVAACRYDQYLGEPFDGVVVPNLVRAVKTNKTGCLKLGTNYLISVKAVEIAQSIHAEAGAALFLDDRPDLPIMERSVTEWDSSCCLFALRDGTIIKIPEGPLILPSVTIQGICALATREGLHIEEREVLYEELVDWVKKGELVTVCSIGTAGILNRCRSLYLRNDSEETIIIHHAQSEHPVFEKLQRVKERYWNMFLGTEEIPKHIPSKVYTV